MLPPEANAGITIWPVRRGSAGMLEIADLQVYIRKLHKSQYN